MKEFVEGLTHEQKEGFKNWYFWSDKELTKLVDIDYDKLSTENFKVLYVARGECKVATVEDIRFYNPDRKDFDFFIGDNGDYFYRSCAPEEVVIFLDQELRKEQNGK